MKKVLLAGDLVGYEKIAISAMIPILSNMGCNVNTLLTSVVSNTFDYGKAEVVDLTDFMRGSLKIWKDLGFKFDMIFTGYLTSMDQVKIIEDLIEYSHNPIVVTDPIMGDDGVLYTGVDNRVKDYTKEMVDHSDIIVPNLTEARILLEEDQDTPYDESIIRSYLDRLSQGKKSVIITSVKLDSETYVYCKNYYDGEGEVFRVPYKLIPYKFAGTGDIFSAMIIGSLAQDKSLKGAISYACKKISSILEKEISLGQFKVNSVHIENHLKEI